MKQEHQQERVGSNNARHKGWLDSKGGRLFLAALGLAMALTAAGCATPFKELSPQEQILEQIKELLEPGNLSDSETVSKILNVKFRKRTMNNSIIYIMSESDFRFESVDYEPNVTAFKVKNRINIRMNMKNICIKISDVFSYFGKNFKKKEEEGSFISCISDCNPTPAPHDYSILVYTYRENIMEFAFRRQECLGSAAVGLTRF